MTRNLTFCSTFALSALALILGSSGCFTVEEGAPLGVGSSDNPEASSVTDPPRSFFILQAADIRSDAWPEAYSDVELFVCNPALSDSDIGQIRRDCPDAIALAYLNAQEVPIHRFDSPYYHQFTAAFDSSLCIIDLVEDKMLILDVDDHPAVVLNQETADILVAFHRDVTMARDWDGLYIDQCNRHFPRAKKRLLEEADTEYDINNDGIADTYEQLEAQYETWRPYFTAELRRVVRRNVASAPRGGLARNRVILLANTGGPLLDPALNGITLEGIGIPYSTEEAIEWALAQEAISVSPTLTGAWLRRWVSVGPSLEFAAQTGGYVGDLSENDAGTPQEF